MLGFRSWGGDASRRESKREATESSAHVSSRFHNAKRIKTGGDTVKTGGDSDGEADAIDIDEAGSRTDDDDDDMLLSPKEGPKRCKHFVIQAFIQSSPDSARKIGNSEVAARGGLGKPLHRAALSWVLLAGGTCCS